MIFIFLSLSLSFSLWTQTFVWISIASRNLFLYVVYILSFTRCKGDYAKREKGILSKEFLYADYGKNSIYSLIVPCSYHHILHKFSRSYNVLICTFIYIHDYDLTRSTVIMIKVFSIFRHETFSILFERKVKYIS